MTLSVLQYLVLSGLLLLPVSINLFSWQSPWLSAIFGGVFLMFQSLVLGRQLFGKYPLLRQSLAGFMAWLMLLVIISTGLYLLWDLSIPLQILAFLLQIGSTAGLMHLSPPSGQTKLEMHNWVWPPRFKTQRHHFFIAAYLLMAGLAFWQLLAARSAAPLLSPWSVLSPVFWVSLALATVLLLIVLWTIPLGEKASLLVSCHLFLLTSVALIVYRLGYGFDSFLHQTTEQIIDTVGFVAPKTPYYLGQYSLIVSLHRLVGISIVTLDRLLLPVLTALSLPLLCAEYFRSSTEAKFPALKQGHWLALLVFCLPFAAFIVTTPQGLANLLFVWLILMSMPLLTHSADSWPLPAFWVLAIAACLIHPLTGIPCLIFCTYLTFTVLKKHFGLSGFITKLIETEAIVLFSVSLPFIFLLWGVFSQQGIRLKPFNQLTWDSLWNLLPKAATLPHPFAPPFIAIAYQTLHWLPFITILAVVLVSLWLLLRGHSSLLGVYGASALTFFLNGILVAIFLQFPQVASTESYAYAGRLMMLTVWCFLPCLLLAGIWLVRNLQQKQPIYWFLLIGLLTATLLATLYGSYPRDNHFEKGRQFSTSATDFRTVKAIDDRSKSDFVVLANQSVSAAAVAQFGFKTYFPQADDTQPLFYYPLPTSSPLYEIYLNMVNDAPRRSTAKQAFTLTGAHSVYFVLNSYWDNAPTLKARALMEADESFDIDNGASTVFVYRFAPAAR